MFKKYFEKSKKYPPLLPKWVYNGIVKKYQPNGGNTMITEVQKKEMLSKAKNLGMDCAIREVVGRSDIRKFSSKPEVEVIEALENHYLNDYDLVAMPVSEDDLLDILGELVEEYETGYEQVFQVYSGRQQF